MRGLGTTSACAENTHPCLPGRGAGRNYLRVRGEYGACCLGGFAFQELPPRARRIRRIRGFYRAENGTTSACAENTMDDITVVEWQGNYLRVRGEYDLESHTRQAEQELPPRARRIP